jgi:replication factor C large subunit
MRRQYYTLWRYATSMMTSGVAKEFVGAGFYPRITSPSRWRRMGTAKKQRIARRMLTAKLGEGYNIPDVQIQKFYLDLLSRLAADDPIVFCERHDLDIDQLAILLHDKVKAASVFKEIQKIAKEKETKLKKISVTKHALTQKIGCERTTESEKFLRKDPPTSPTRQLKFATESAVKTLKSSQEEEKKAPTQMTLEFF